MWYNARELGIRGGGWQVPDVATAFHRLPSRAEATVPEKVWNLSLKPAGLYVDFLTNAKQIPARWQSTVEVARGYADSGALLTGGLDAYGLCPQRGWRWVGQCVPNGDDGMQHQGRINKPDLDGEQRLYRVYLGIGTPVESLDIAVEEGATLSPAPAEDASKLIVAYGTSIVHGWTVGRPSMAHPQIMARAMQRPLIGLGFAGNARMEVALAELLAELNPAVYTVDCLPNMGPELIHQRFRPFLDMLRAKRPDTPILFISDRVFGDHSFCPQRGEKWRNNNKALESEFLKAEADGVPHIGLLPGMDFFGDDTLGTTDGSHPNALGAWRMAQIVKGALEQRGW